MREAHPHLVLLQGGSPAQLRAHYRALQKAGIPVYPFIEPDRGHELTAIAPAPLDRAARKRFSNSPTYKLKETNMTAYQRNPKWSSVPVYYRLSYEDFRMLKALHKWYHKNLTWTANQMRWYRKMIQNRIGAPPKAFRPLNLDIVDLYQEARQPSTIPVTPYSEKLLQGIRLNYREMAVFVAKNYPQYGERATV